MIFHAKGLSDFIIMIYEIFPLEKLEKYRMHNTYHSCIDIELYQD